MKFYFLAILSIPVIILNAQVPDTTIAEFPDTASSSLSFGYNFDFEQGIKASEFYADYRFDAPKISSSRFGLEVGITQQRTITFQDTTSKDFYDIYPNLVNDTVTGLNYITIKTSGSSKEQVENLSLSVVPKWLIIKALNDKGSRFYIVGNVEVIRSRNESLTTYTTIQRDTFPKAPETWPRPYDLSPVPTSAVSKSTAYNFYCGAGLEYQHRDKYADFKFRLLPGFQYSRIITSIPQTSANNLDAWFYLAQAEVLEKRAAGIKLGIEVRGTFKNNSSPWVSIYMAKRFTLSRLAELFKPS